jgi:predicted O-methyltransferase YrrM
MIDDHVRAVLDRLYADDEQQRNANLPTSQRTRNLTPDSGRFLMMLAASSNARRVVEIGSSNGVSTIWLAAAMRATGGLAIGTELIPERAAEANANLAEAGLQTFARVLAGAAGELANELKGPFDLAFIDAEKDDYIAHFELVWPLMRPRGIVVADNVISHDVLAYQEMLRAREDCATLTLPLDRGLELTLRLR